jgi:hypothetical protein
MWKRLQAFGGGVRPSGESLDAGIPSGEYGALSSQPPADPVRIDPIHNDTPHFHVADSDPLGRFIPRRHSGAKCPDWAHVDRRHNFPGFRLVVGLCRQRGR